MINLSNWSNVPVTNNYHKSLPATPGIYVFLDSKGAPAYVGQAVNLRDRHSSTHHALGRAYGAGVGITTVCWQESNSEESLCELECAAYSFLTKQGGCKLINISDPCVVREVSKPYMGDNADLKDTAERFIVVHNNLGELEREKEDIKQMLLNYARSGIWDGKPLVSELGYRLSLRHDDKTQVWLIAPPDEWLELQKEQQDAKARMRYLEDQASKYLEMCVEKGWREVVLNKPTGVTKTKVKVQ